MANIVSTDEDGIHTVDRITPRPLVLRRDAEWFASVEAGNLHPRVTAALRKLQERKTGSYVDWPWIDKNLVSIKGDVLRILEAIRTPARQDELYRQGRTEGGSIVTKAQAYRSYHQWGCAVDLVFTRYGYEPFTVDGVLYDFDSPASWLRTGVPQFLEIEGLTWGGRWRDLSDPSHFQYETEVPVDDAFCGSPWWNLGADTVVIEKRKTGGGGQLWVVAGIAAGAWILTRRKG